MNARDVPRELCAAHERSLSAPGFDAIDEALNLILAGVCGLAAGVLLAMGGHRAGFDAMHAMGAGLPAMLLQGLSIFGETLPAICLLALLASRRPRVVWTALLAGMYATILTHTLKHLSDTVRPPGIFGDLIVVTGPILRMHSFPSGHTATAFLLAACFSAGATRSVKFALYALAALVGISRVWVGVHWPVDVIVGAGAAGLSTALAIRTVSLANRQLGLAPHLVVVAAIAGGALWELVRASEFPLAHLLEVAIAALALSVLARDFWIAPWLRTRSSRDSRQDSLAPMRNPRNTR